MKNKLVSVIGGGAAGFFAAIHAAKNKNNQVTIYEATNKTLEKVLLSGGGRCNVTHHCFEPAELVKHYPRGSKELLGPFNRFQPRDMIDWLKEQEVEVKTEGDGRIFPLTDSSRTIIEALKNAAVKSGVVLRKNAAVKAIHFNGSAFELVFFDNRSASCDAVVLATGSSKPGYRLAEHLGIKIIDPVPSLFTFKIKDPRITNLSGVSFPQVSATLKLKSGVEFTQTGPLLITHWGMSGPAVLKLSAFAARELFQSEYQAELIIDFTVGQTNLPDDLILQFRNEQGKKLLSSIVPYGLPKRYWQQLLETLGCPEETRWSQLSKPMEQKLINELTKASFKVSGKGVFKEEFVTCGGVALDEIDFKTMMSKKVRNLFFAGEILNIDGVTGGFNFQNAWTTGFITGQSIAQE